MIIYTPIDMPKLVVDDWSIFWDIWNTEASELIKVRQNTQSSPTQIGHSNIWNGLDVFRVNPSFLSSWKCKFVNIKTKLPKLYKSLEDINQLIPVYCIRLIQSNIPITSHTDDNLDIWSIRAYLHYTDSKSQWYFTKPNDRNGKRTYSNLPDQTKWFAYNDKYCWHGTDFDPNHKKILVQIYPINYLHKGIINVVEAGKEKYKKYTIDHEIL